MHNPLNRNNLKIIALLGYFLLSCFAAQAQVPVPFTPRLPNGSLRIKGDIVYVGNNILNGADVNNPSQANTPYNGTADNNALNMEYIDIDGDPSTFSSSSASLALTSSCSKVAYAGLYWASTYPYERSTNSNSQWQGTPRFNDWNQVKFKLPGGNYINLTADNNADAAGEEDAIIFDGYNATNISNSFKDSPIICYKNVTSLVRTLANPNGSYTLANLRAAKGRREGASSAGWVMVIIYENPTMPGKFISTFDGYAGVANNFSANIDINGFVTLPPPFPVRAKLGVAALEGDKGLTNDRLQIKANSNTVFTNVFNALNPADNFFNSTISDNGAQVLNRIPNGTNTLGLDLDMIPLSNPQNGIIPNNETGATLKLITSGDGYGAFLTSFAVEIIEPQIKLVKNVRDISGADIGGADVNLGQVLDYVINFQNIGNDDATNLTIRDILPVNTFFNSVDLSGAPGVTYVYNPITRQILFSLPPNLVEIGDPSYTIKIRVQVVNTCSELTDACSNIIQNLAYTTYNGVLNNSVISDDPSFAGVDSCGLGIQGPANFLVDIDECAFLRNEILCGASIVLTAGNGYASYEWHNSSGAIIGTSQSITVSAPGNYYVINTPTPPCIGITEYINVTLFGSNQTNPVLPYADEIGICPNNGEELPKIFLCGLNDSQLIQTNITDATSIIWEKLNEASCPAVGIDDCANKNQLCSWSQVGIGTNFNATLAGQYRVVINYQNGCFNRYYFNVYTNLLDAHHTVQNITCNTPGKITVTNVPSTYEFQLVDQNTNTVLAGYQNSPIFPIAQAGSYLIYIRQQGVTDGCVFTIPNIGVSDLDLDVNIITRNTFCNGFGSIRVQALNVGPQYTFSISGASTDTHGPLIDNDYTFTGLNPGIYTITVTTEDGCTFTENATILDNSNLSLTATVSQNISCISGFVQLTPEGGEAPYVYAIYSHNANLLNPSAGDYTDVNPFEFIPGQEGTYVFIMVDNNNCTALSNPVTIGNIPDIAYTTSFENISCFGANDGSINYTVTNSNGFGVSYELLDAIGTVVSTNSSGIFNNLAPGNYTVNLIQTSALASCRFPTNFTLTQPNALTGTASATQPYNCITSGGTISINPGSVTGGTTTYQYSIDGINFGSATSFSNLTAGTYTIKIKDANECIFSTNAITFNTLTPPTNIQFVGSPLTCPLLTSNVTLTSTGGTAPLNYSITAPLASAINNGTDPVFSSLSAGTYTFKITDSNGCFYEKNYTINAVLPIHVTGQTISNVICFGESNGTLNYTVSNFVSTYDFAIANDSGTIISSGTNATNATILLNNLLQGIYTITVTDNTTNCTDTATVTIAGPAIALSLSTDVTAIKCNATGSVTATANGGWGNYQYQLLLPNGTIVGPQSSAIFSNLSLPGSYAISVKDANNCTLTQAFILSIPTNPEATIATTSDICYDTTNGASLTIDVIGGLFPYSYSINGAAGQASNVFSNLTPGTYTIIVTDANNCTDTVSQIIGQQLTATAVLDKNLDCTTTPNAVIEVAIIGGQAPYTFKTAFNGSAYGTSSAVTGTTISHTTAIAGTYQFQITDSVGCIIQTNIITITPITPPEITSITQTRNILCHGDNSGAISIIINTNVGTAPIAISVINTTTGTNYGSQTSGLPAGNYAIKITDSNSCTDTATIILGEPDAITYSISTVDITCNNPGGTSFGEVIVENVSGGTPGFSYNVSNNFGFFATYNATSGEDHSFQILQFGIYQVDVIDANGCSVATRNIIIASPPDDLTIDVSATTANCADGGTAVLTVSAAVTSGTYQFAILETNTPPYSTAYQNADSGTPLTSTFTGLIPGVTYTFVVYDSTTDCYYLKSASLPIDSPSNLTSVLNVVSNVSCTGSANGNVSFTFSNYSGTGVNYEIFNAQSNISTGFSGSSTGLTGPSVTISNFGLLPPGNYYILFNEIGGPFAGCTNASSQFSISQSTNLLAVTVEATKNDNCKTNAGQITAIGQFGTPPYEYQLVTTGSPAPTAATWTGNIANVFNTEGGNYTVYIKDANNCIQSDAIILPTDQTPAITAFVSNQCNTTQGNFTIQVNQTLSGIAPYSYSFNGGAFQNQTAASFTYSNLASGVYTIEIKDANGCGNQVSVEIFAPIDLTPIASTQPSCTNNDGEIIVTAFGGSGNYEYELQDNIGNTIAIPQAANNFTGLGSGNYIVVIHDTDSNCTADAAISLEIPTPVIFTVTSEDVSCNSGNDGTISITLPASNNNVPYTFTASNGVDPTITQSNPQFTGLPAGSYTITVTSAKNCSDTEIVIVKEPSLLTINASATDFACDATNTVSTAVITVVVENDLTGNPSGTAPYTYSINGTNFFPTNTFIIDDSGNIQNITVTVKDNNNCVQTTPVVINPLPELTAVTAIQGTAITCTNDETVQVSVTGGSGDFTFDLLPLGSQPSITPGIGIQTASFQLTTPGSYTFQVTDNVTGCYMLAIPYQIIPFDTLDVAASNPTQVTCFGESNGTLTLNVSGYTGNYSYTVKDSSNTTMASGNSSTAANPFVISGLPAGNLYVTVNATETPFCSEDSNMVTIPSPATPLTLTANATANVTCDNDRGEIVASAFGGWGTYLYQLTNTTTSTIVQAYASNSIFTALPAGNYSISVKDNGGCIVSESVILTRPAFITANINASTTHLLCNGDTNAIISAINVTGGEGSYQYILNYYNTAGTTIILSNGPQSSPQFENIGAGIYSITVIDGWNCDVATTTIAITEPTPVRGFLSVSSTLTCTTQASLTISGSGGTPPYQFSTDGTIYSSTNTYNVGPGTYQYYVKDNNGCEAVLTNQITIQPVPPLLLNLDLSSATINCSGESTATITANTTGGLGNYSYELLDNASNVLQGPQAGQSFTNLPAGNYYIRVVSGDCNATSPAITISNPQQLVVNHSKRDVLCFGETNGTIEITTTGGTGIIQYAISPNLNQFVTTNRFTGLAPGIYDVIVQDQNGCFEQLQIEILEPQPLEATFGLIEQELCINDADGSISIDITGGTGTYEVSLDGINYLPVTGSHYTFSNLVGDVLYLIFVRDANGCNINPPLEQYLNPAVEVIPSVNVDPTCNSNIPGTIATISVNVAVVNDVQYSLDGVTYASSNTFSNLAPGNYTAYVQHTNGCTKTVPFTIDNLLPIITTANITANVLCFGEATGEIQVISTGGTGTLQYAISPSFIFGSANTFSNLSAGIYEIRVKDGIGCEMSIQNISITQPSQALSATLVQTSETCLGNNDGSVTITPSGGTAPYFTSLDSNNAADFTQDLFVYQNLADGNHTIYVKDANGCEITPRVFAILPGVTIQPDATVAYNCTGNIPGNVTTVAVYAPVSGQVQYSLDNINYVSTNTFTNLAPGNYTVYVKHTNGCVQTDTFTIDNLLPISATANVTANVLCFGNATGIIEVNATGGTRALQYAISPSFVYGNANTFNNLSAGTYEIRVKDAIGCVFTISNINVIQPNAMSITEIARTEQLCSGDSNGSVTIYVTGGSAPYSTSLNSQNPGNFVAGQFTFTNLTGGRTHVIYVKDANGCITAFNVANLATPVNIQPTAVVTPSCENNISGFTVVINVSSTVINDVQYSLDGITYGTTNIFNNLPAGTYTAYVKHTNGCIKTAPFTIITVAPITINTTINPVRCNGEATGSIRAMASGGRNGFKYGISPDYVLSTSNQFQNLAAGIYTVRAVDALGCYAETQVTINEPDAIQIIIADVLQEICSDDDNGAIEINVTGGTAPYFTSLSANGPFIRGNYLFENLNGGTTYTIYVKDANSCIVSIPVVLDNPIDIQAAVNIAYTCEGNLVTITVDSSVSNDVTYSLNGGISQTGNSFTNLQNGNYTVEILHALGCTDNVRFTISNPTPLRLTLAETNMNKITATAFGGSGGYNYIFNGVNNGSNNVYVFYETGTYNVTVIDSRGCEAHEIINVVFVDIDIPNVVTPNDDGQNDTWSPHHTENYPNITTDIFDRYGRKLATLRQGQTWDGRYNGTEMPTGDYWYLIKLGNPEDDRDFVGNFTIYR